MKLLKKLIVVLLSLVAVCVVGGAVAFYALTYKPTDEAVQYASTAQTHDGVKVFKSTSQGDEKGQIVFYGGGLVEDASYAKLGAKLADRGYSFYLIHSTLNLPVLSIQKAQQVIHRYGLKHVYLGGHSLGGVVAAMNAENAGDAGSSGEIDGLLFLASYPPESVDLSSRKLRVLSLTASNDKVLQWDNYEKAKKRLPSDASYVTIDGGNHSGFGLYGHQRGDGEATISADEQQDEIVDQIARFIG
ncbi:alpha/beta hydrolase [Alloscardovia omnicolens]|uniref:alpha/beta hydrolase n=1 Tax=Alloscardovia omnicolens TaxID=419015 RepID=UPI003A62FD44